MKTKLDIIVEKIVNSVFEKLNPIQENYGGECAIIVNNKEEVFSGTKEACNAFIQQILSVVGELGGNVLQSDDRYIVNGTTLYSIVNKKPNSQITENVIREFYEDEAYYDHYPNPEPSSKNYKLYKDVDEGYRVTTNSESLIEDLIENFPSIEKYIKNNYDGVSKYDMNQYDTYSIDVYSWEGSFKDHDEGYRAFEKLWSFLENAEKKVKEYWRRDDIKAREEWADSKYARQERFYSSGGY